MKSDLSTALQNTSIFKLGIQLSEQSAYQASTYEAQGLTPHSA